MSESAGANGVRDRLARIAVHVQRCRRAGQSDAQIRQRLLSYGLHATLVDSLLSELRATPSEARQGW